MSKLHAATIVLVLLALVAGGCGSDESGSTTRKSKPRASATTGSTSTDAGDEGDSKPATIEESPAPETDYDTRTATNLGVLVEDRAAWLVLAQQYADAHAQEFYGTGERIKLRGPRPRTWFMAGLGNSEFGEGTFTLRLGGGPTATFLFERATTEKAPWRVISGSTVGDASYLCTLPEPLIAAWHGELVKGCA